jgi:hypothetical protein
MAVFLINNRKTCAHFLSVIEGHLIQFNLSLWSLWAFCFSKRLTSFLIFLMIPTGYHNNVSKTNQHRSLHLVKTVAKRHNTIWPGLLGATDPIKQAQNKVKRQWWIHTPWLMHPQVTTPQGANSRDTLCLWVGRGVGAVNTLRYGVVDYVIFLITWYDIIFWWWSYICNSDQNLC